MNFQNRYFIVRSALVRDEDIKPSQLSKHGPWLLECEAMMSDSDAQVQYSTKPPRSAQSLLENADSSVFRMPQKKGTSDATVDTVIETMPVAELASRAVDPKPAPVTPATAESIWSQVIGAFHTKSK